MPEGDTIFRLALRLKASLLDAIILAATDNGRFIDGSALVGQTIRGVDAKGKHLLIQLGDGRVLHSHMGMTGSWKTFHSGEVWRKAPHAAALALDLNDSRDSFLQVVCFHPKTLELLSSTQLRRHPVLNRLGPDLMDPRFEPADALRRFRTHNQAAIGETVMNQSIVCGIGNIYKSETLFVARTNPFVPVGQLHDSQVINIVTTAHQLMRRNLSEEKRRTRMRNDGPRVWVYRRRGERCLECGARIRMRRQGDLGRSTYWCPMCQPA